MSRTRYIHNALEYKPQIVDWARSASIILVLAVISTLVLKWIMNNMFVPIEKIEEKMSGKKGYKCKRGSKGSRSKTM